MKANTKTERGKKRARAGIMSDLRQENGRSHVAPEMLVWAALATKGAAGCPRG